MFPEIVLDAHTLHMPDVRIRRGSWGAYSTRIGRGNGLSTNCGLVTSPQSTTLRDVAIFPVHTTLSAPLLYRDDIACS